MPGVFPPLTGNPEVLLKVKELIKAYPDLKGIQGSASTTAAGAGLAVEEKGLQDKIAVVGCGLVSSRAFSKSAGGRASKTLKA